MFRAAEPWFMETTDLFNLLAIVQLLLWTNLLNIGTTNALLVSSIDLMKCSYGERGSLTATCVRANASFFKATSYRFDQLDETLKCVNCTLNTIESNTFDISGNMIKHLILQNSKIEMLKPKAFIGLIFLENLDLSFNDIRSVYPGTFTGIKKIKKIDLSHNKINILSDDGFLELLNLEDLTLERNNIQTISSKAFNGLVNLRRLNIGNNRINAISNVFSDISPLLFLNLKNNHISRLEGSEFENLTSLIELNLAFNVLQEPILQLKPDNKLQKLHLYSNSITKIKSDYFSSLHNLEILDLTSNSIANINNNELLGLNGLRILNISYNMMTTLSTGAFTGLPQLENLNVSHNKISEILNTGMLSIHSLHSLDISYNSLTDLDYQGLLYKLPRLSYIKMDNNLLPCDLEKEMEEHFQEDNFKFIFYEPLVGSVKCVDTYVKKRKPVMESFIKDETPNHTISGLEITFIILICFITISIAFLYYLQYRTYQNLSFSTPHRAISAVHLVPSEIENREGEDLS